MKIVNYFELQSRICLNIKKDSFEEYIDIVDTINLIEKIG